MDNMIVFSVFEISRHIRQVLESTIEALYIKGEISNFVHHSSGHMYFNLKDENATLRCTFFKNANYRLDFKPKDGDSVICYGKITLYEKGGTYNLNVSSMIPAGLGAMQMRFEELKGKLKAEGLFEPEHKKTLPAYPESIGIITSPTGAALQDISNILSRRFPVSAYVYPSLVQGSEAPITLIKGIEYFNQIQEVDLIILTRGGGSQEDLFCFNDEALARAIFHSKIPIISAVGHEIDYTISDFVADLRAPTPSAAAEIAVPNRDDLLALISSYHHRMNSSCESKLNQKKHECSQQQLQLSRFHPERIWQEYQQRYDMAEIALQRFQDILKEPMLRVNSLQTRLIELAHSRIEGKISQYQMQMDNLNYQLQQRVILQQSKLTTKLENLAMVLQQQSPTHILKKGYSITTKNGKIVADIEQLSKGDNIEIMLHGGKAGAVIENTENI